MKQNQQCSYEFAQMQLANMAYPGMAPRKKIGLAVKVLIQFASVCKNKMWQPLWIVIICTSHEISVQQCLRLKYVKCETNMFIPCTNKLITGRHAFPFVDGLKRSKIQRETFGTVKPADVARCTLSFNCFHWLWASHWLTQRHKESTKRQRH